MHTQTKLSSTTLTYLAGIGGSGPLPADAEQLSRHGKDHYQKRKPGFWQQIKQWAKAWSDRS